MIYKNFSETSGFEKLVRCAGKSFDLTRPGALTEDGRLQKYKCCSRFLNLHYATEKIDDLVLEAFQEIADELQLVSQFKAMRRGAVLNRIEGSESENRRVLHTATRDIFSGAACCPEATQAFRAELEKLHSFLAGIDSGELTGTTGKKFDTVIHVGIGGSELGPRAIYEALSGYGLRGRTVKFLANVDPDDASRILKEQDLSTCLVNTVSKSGTTIETLTNQERIVAALKAQNLRPEKHCIAVTGEGSPMDDPSKYLRSFYMHDYIGGRYSSTSMVGAVSLAFFMGLDNFHCFLEGANDMDVHAEEEKVTENIPLLLSLIGLWNHNVLGTPSLAILPYSQGLRRFPAHLQQCDMESNGKRVHRNGEFVRIKTGPVVWGEPGTNGQHAFYQLLHQGTEIVPVEFIGFRNSQYSQDITTFGTTSQQKLQANLYAQMVAMAIGQSDENPNKCFPGNRPSCLILGERLEPATMGALLALYEAKIVYQGFLWNINSFDQEGVQLGKVLAGNFLQRMQDEDSRCRGIENEFLKSLNEPKYWD